MSRNEACSQHRTETGDTLPRESAHSTNITCARPLNVLKFLGLRLSCFRRALTDVLFLLFVPSALRGVQHRALVVFIKLERCPPGFGSEKLGWFGVRWGWPPRSRACTVQFLSSQWGPTTAWNTVGLLGAQYFCGCSGQALLLQGLLGRSNMLASSPATLARGVTRLTTARRTADSADANE